MSRTIKAIERHMILAVRSKTDLATASPSTGSRRELGFPSRAAKLVAEWQQRGPETLSGHVVGKLRLAFAPTQSAVAANAAG